MPHSGSNFAENQSKWEENRNHLALSRKNIKKKKTLSKTRYPPCLTTIWNPLLFALHICDVGRASCIQERVSRFRAQPRPPEYRKDVLQCSFRPPALHADSVFLALFDGVAVGAAGDVVADGSPKPLFGNAANRFAAHRFGMLDVMKK